jgi:hypothetical protein
MKPNLKKILLLSLSAIFLGVNIAGAADGPLAPQVTLAVNGVSYWLPENERLRVDAQKDSCLALAASSLSQAFKTEKGRRLITDPRLQNTEITFRIVNSKSRPEDKTKPTVYSAKNKSLSVPNETERRSVAVQFNELSIVRILLDKQKSGPGNARPTLQENRLNAQNNLNFTFYKETFKEAGFWSLLLTGDFILKEKRERDFCAYSTDDVFSTLENTIKVMPDANKVLSLKLQVAKEIDEHRTNALSPNSKPTEAIGAWH